MGKAIHDANCDISIGLCVGEKISTVTDDKIQPPESPLNSRLKNKEQARFIPGFLALGWIPFLSHAGVMGVTYQAAFSQDIRREWTVFANVCLVQDPVLESGCPFMSEPGQCPMDLSKPVPVGRPRLQSPERYR